MPRPRCLPEVPRTVLQHRGSLSFPYEFCQQEFRLPLSDEAETNLFFVLFSGRRCPSQKLRTHLFWGISQNLPPSSQEPTEDVLPLWSPACLLQEGNPWMLATAVLMDLSELPLQPFVSLILPGLVVWAFSVHSLQSFLWGPGVFCAPEHSNQLLA